MKAVLQAGWLLTVAVGNFIVLIVANIAKIPERVRKNNNISHTFQTMKMCDRDRWWCSPTFVSLSLSLISHLKWAEYILFASLLVVVCVIFSIMAYFYTYLDPAAIEAQFKKKDDEEDDKSELGKREIEMVKKGSFRDNDQEDKATNMWT